MEKFEFCVDLKSIKQLLTNLVLLFSHLKMFNIYGHEKASIQEQIRIGLKCWIRIRTGLMQILNTRIHET